jgi:hypothetical protein
MEASYGCANVRVGRRRRFSITQRHETLLEIDYRARDCDWDPAFDHIDLEAGDFFFMAAEIWNDPLRRDALLNLYRERRGDANAPSVSERGQGDT